MPKLRCNATNCMYNTDKYCCRNRIHIQGYDANCEEDTQCGTFKECQNDSRSMLNEFALFKEANEHLSINCDCQECIYNDKELCTKEHVRIVGMNALCRQDTCCESFEKKE